MHEKSSLLADENNAFMVQRNGSYDDLLTPVCLRGSEIRSNLSVLRATLLVAQSMLLCSVSSMSYSDGVVVEGLQV